jgi:WD40 repeat protein
MTSVTWRCRRTTASALQRLQHGSALALLYLLRQTASERLTDNVGCLGARLVSGGGDRQVFVWDVATGRTIRKFRGHDGIVNTVCP